MNTGFEKDITIFSQLLLPECSEKQATALLLFYFYGRKKTASIMGLQINSVRDYVYRARIKIRKTNDIEDVEHFLIRRILQKIDY